MCQQRMEGAPNRLLSARPSQILNAISSIGRSIAMPGSRTLQSILVSLFACATLCACGNGAKETAEPPSPATRIVIPTPAPVEDQPPTDLPDINSSPHSILSPELHARFTRGLPLAEAQALTSVPAVRVGGDGQSTEIYRWNDENGASFTARFDGGKLTTKSSLGTQSASNAPSSLSAEVDVDTMPVAQIAPGVYIPLERAVIAATEQPLGTSQVPDAPAPAEERPNATPTPAAPTGPTIAIAGAARRGRKAAKTSSYNPHAALPEFSRSLEEGSFEIRFLNPSDTPMTAGLRQDKLGKDVAIPPKGQASIKVNRGVYQLFFLRESDPDTLFEAPTITIDGFQATDVEVHLDPENVEVRLIDYSKPSS